MSLKTMADKKLYSDVAAIMAGILLTLAFSPFDYSFLALLSLLILFFLWRGVSAIRAGWLGFLFGLGQFGFGVSWVYISMHDFGGAGILVSSLLTLLFFSFWALFPAMSGFLAVWLSQGRKTNFVWLLFPVVWILVEFLRGYWVINGFPWLLLAYSQLDTPLGGYLPIVGVFGTGFLLALTASAVLELISIPNKASPYFAGLLVIVWFCGWGLKNQSWTEIAGDALKVTLIQGNIDQDKKWLPVNRDRILQSYKELTVKNWDSQIIVWPETAVPAFYDEVKDSFLLPLEAEAKRTGTDLIFSIPVRGDKNKEYYNAVITLGRHNSIYKKIHLLPFGEYLPLQPFSGYLLENLEIPLGEFTAGSKDQTLLQAAGYRFKTSICYEDAFGNEGIRGLPEAAFLVNVTNDAWFGDSLEPHQHLQIARMRAIETGRYLLRATNSGVTAIVAPDGRLIKQAPLFETTTITSEIYPMRGATPYVKFGDRPVILILSFLLFVSWIMKVVKKSGSAEAKIIASR
jgi:apolipoprotein N-acyltransferase